MPLLRPLSLRPLLLAAGACAIGTAALAATEPYAPPAPASATLKDTFQDAFLIGVALNARQASGEDPVATALVTREFNSTTAENEMKWERVEPEPDTFTFELADEFVEFSQQHDMVIIGHNLCWHAQLPSWVSEPEPGSDTLTREVLLARLKHHIFQTAARYRGKIHGWDVVNEAIADGTGEYRDSIFYQLTGTDYLVLAFKWAREAAPDAELYYNDYNLDADDLKRAKAIELVKLLRAEGAPIDGIGLQGHYNLTNPTTAKIDETIQLFADLDLKVMITELDVQAIRDRDVSGAVDAEGPPPAQRWMRRLFPSAEDVQTKLALTPAQAAAVLPLVQQARADLEAAINARAFPRIRKIREGATEAIAALLTAEQQAPFKDLMVIPPPPPPPPLTAEQQFELAQRYGEIFEVFLKHREAITRVTFWGLRDAESWRRQSSPLLFDDDYQRKPAYDAVIAAAKKAGL